MAEADKKISRKRGKNFDYSEKLLLADLAIENKEILDSKLTNQVTNIMKQKIWESTQSKINSLGYANRSTTEVKNKWSNMVQKAKKENSEFKKKMSKTGGGGGPQPTPISPISARIIEVYGDTPGFSGLTGVESSSFDEDARDSNLVKIVAQESSSPRSFQLVLDAVTTIDEMSPSGDAVEIPRRSSTDANQDVRRNCTTVSGGCSTTTISQTSTPVQISTPVIDSLSTRQTPTIQSTAPKSTAPKSTAPPILTTAPSRQSTAPTRQGTAGGNLIRKPTEKITDIQYQVLQLQREQLINQKETEKLVRGKLTEQIKNLKLKI